MSIYRAVISPRKPRSFDEGLTIEVFYPAARRREALARFDRYLAPHFFLLDLDCLAPRDPRLNWKKAEAKEK